MDNEGGRYYEIEDNSAFVRPRVASDDPDLLELKQGWSSSFIAKPPPIRNVTLSRSYVEESGPDISPQHLQEDVSPQVSPNFPSLFEMVSPRDREGANPGEQPTGVASPGEITESNRMFEPLAPSPPATNKDKAVTPKVTEVTYTQVTMPSPPNTTRPRTSFCGLQKLRHFL